MYTKRFFYRVLWAAGLCMLCFTGCKTNKGSNEDVELEAAESHAHTTAVDIMALPKQAFTAELISNGKLRAGRQSILHFPLSEQLMSLEVSAGDRVEKGQLLAVLCSERIERQLEQARLRFYRASLDMEDILLGRGHTLSDSLSIDSELWSMAGVRSDYTAARQELKSLESDLQKTRITAPFSGLIADIEVRQYERVGAGSVFCRLIDDAFFWVDFSIMENELAFVQPQMPMECEPFGLPDTRYSGQLKQINPVVDKNGQVQLSAQIPGASKLMEGMNLRIFLKKHIPDQLVVPKSAVLYRDNLEVLFRYEKGRAEWTYVNILHQNSTHYSLMANPDRVASLAKGDTVIISGHINLAHGASVSIK